MGAVLPEALAHPPWTKKRCNAAQTQPLLPKLRGNHFLSPLPLGFTEQFQRNVWRQIHGGPNFSRRCPCSHDATA